MNDWQNLSGAADGKLHFSVFEKCEGKKGGKGLAGFPNVPLWCEASGKLEESLLLYNPLWDTILISLEKALKRNG